MATKAKDIRELELATSGGGTEGSGNGGDTDVRNTETEYCCAIYCDATDSGPMRAGHSEARSAGLSGGGSRPE